MLRDTGLPVEFVGHPFTAPDYAAPVSHDPTGPVLLLPGSRVKAVARIFPAILAGFRQFDGRTPGAAPSSCIPARRSARSSRRSRSRRAYGSSGPGLPIAASATLTSSGTMSMHCALAGIPGAIAYRTDPFTYAMARWLVQVPYLGIANILLGEPVYPEYIQGAATAASLSAELAACIADPRRRERSAAQSRLLKKMLAPPPGDNEADWLSRSLR